MFIRGPPSKHSSAEIISSGRPIDSFRRLATIRNSATFFLPPSPQYEAEGVETHLDSSLVTHPLCSVKENYNESNYIHHDYSKLSLTYESTVPLHLHPMSTLADPSPSRSGLDTLRPRPCHVSQAHRPLSVQIHVQILLVG